MGDLAHTLYAVDDLARYQPDIELHWICEESFSDIPKLHPFVRKVITFSWREYCYKLRLLKIFGSIKRIKTLLKTEKYDLVIDNQGLIKSALIARLAKAPIHGFSKNCVREKIATNFYTNCYYITEKDNVIWKNRQLFSLIFSYRNKINRQDYNVNLTISDTTRLDFLDYKKFHIAIHGTSKDYKLWSENYWQTLLQKKYLDDRLPILLTWGNIKEYETSKRIARNLDFVHVCPKMTLTQVAKLLTLSESVVSVDTGLLHLANVLNKPTVAIYLNSSTSNTKTENRDWEQVIGGLKTDVTVNEVYKIWNQVLKNKNIVNND